MNWLIVVAALPFIGVGVVMAFVCRAVQVGWELCTDWLSNL